MKTSELISQLLKDYDCTANKMTLQFKSEKDMIDAADDIANAKPFIIDQDDLTLTFLSESAIKVANNAYQIYQNLDELSINKIAKSMQLNESEEIIAMSKGLYNDVNKRTLCAHLGINDLMPDDSTNDIDTANAPELAQVANESHIHSVKFKSFEDAEKSANAKGVNFANTKFNVIGKDDGPKSRYNIADLVTKSGKVLGIIKYNQETKLAIVELEDSVNKDSIFDTFVNESAEYNSFTNTIHIDKYPSGGSASNFNNETQALRNEMHLFISDDYGDTPDKEKNEHIVNFIKQLGSLRVAKNSYEGFFAIGKNEQYYLFIKTLNFKTLAAIYELGLKLNLDSKINTFKAQKNSSEQFYKADIQNMLSTYNKIYSSLKEKALYKSSKNVEVIVQAASVGFGISQKVNRGAIFKVLAVDINADEVLCNCNKVDKDVYVNVLDLANMQHIGFANESDEELKLEVSVRYAKLANDALNDARNIKANQIASNVWTIDIADKDDIDELFKQWNIKEYEFVNESAKTYAEFVAKNSPTPININNVQVGYVLGYKDTVCEVVDIDNNALICNVKVSSNPKYVVGAQLPIFKTSSRIILTKLQDSFVNESSANTKIYETRSAITKILLNSKLNNNEMLETLEPLVLELKGKGNLKTWLTIKDTMSLNESNAPEVFAKKREIEDKLKNTNLSEQERRQLEDLLYQVNSNIGRHNLNESSMKSIIDKKFWVKPFDLVQGQQYTWFMGAEPLICTYVGMDLEKGGFNFKLGKSNHRLSGKDVQEYIFALEYMNESAADNVKSIKDVVDSATAEYYFNNVMDKDYTSREYKKYFTEKADSSYSNDFKAGDDIKYIELYQKTPKTRKVLFFDKSTGIMIVGFPADYVWSGRIIKNLTTGKTFTINESTEAPYDVALTNGKVIKKGSKCEVVDITDSKEKQAKTTKLEVKCSEGKAILVFDNDDEDLKMWINESAVAYKVPRSAFANPWLTHKIQSASWIRPYEFGNAFNDGIVNAEVACTGCVAEEYPIETATNIKAVYVNESNEICFAPAVPAYISENGQINSADEFKEYAKVVLKEAHGDDYDESIADKTISGLLDKYDNNYGAMIGALTSGFGN